MRNSTGFERAPDAVVPPRRHAGGAQDLRLVALAQQREPGVGDRQRRVELLLEDEGGAGGFVAERPEERVGAGVGGEEARAVGAAVEAEPERAVRPPRAGPEGRRAATGQVLLALRTRSRATPVRWTEGRTADRTDDALRVVEGGAAPRSGRTRRGRSRRPAVVGVVHGDDQAVGIEVGLGEDPAFEEGGRAEGVSAAGGVGLVPDVGEGRRVGVPEAAKRDHGRLSRTRREDGGSGRFCQYYSGK